MISIYAVLTGSLRAHVILDYPEGGETFVSGETIRIEWHIEIQHNQLNWDLYFSEDGGDTWEVIVLDLDNAKTDYAWTIPEIATEAARIQILQDNVRTDYIGESGDFVIQTPAVLENDQWANPTAFVLHVNYPNPFNPSTIINYELLMTSEIELSIYNSLGQRVTILFSGKKETGKHEIKWDASEFASGVYYYQLRAGEFVDVKKMILLR
jgi:hypothetical protein